MSSNASSKYPVRVPEAKKAELYRLTNPPKVAWPTVAVLAYVVFGVIAVDVAALKGWIPLWAGSLLNVCAMYPFFHVMHDAMHRSASRNVVLNDLIGGLALVVTGSLGTLAVVRYAHMMHHRFTNDENDPDHYFHGAWWTLPFRWMTADFRYSWYNLQSDDPRAQKVMRDNIPYMITMLAIYGAIISFGYGWELVMLLFVPQRLTLLLMSFAFLWLPHLDGDENGELSHIRPAASTSHNLTAGTTMRLGFEKLLNPLLQWHNYHLIHHLWPTTPSYNHAKVWKLMEPELRERDLRIQHGFDLIPTLHAGNTPTPSARSATGLRGVTA
jgi:fatty acid desaturase